MSIFDKNNDRMNFKFLVILGLVILNSLVSPAQESFYHSSGDKDYLTGLELYENSKYSAAQQFFDRYVENHRGVNSEEVTASSYYSAMAAIKLMNNDAESRVQKFIAENPQSSYVNDLIFNLASYYYQRRSYSNSLDYYERVDVKNVAQKDLPEYYFMSGYSYFLRQDMDKAMFNFGQVKDNTGSKYASPSLYYYSHINYSKGNYETALEGFTKLEGDANFGPIVPYYIIQIYYMQERYDMVTKTAPDLMQAASEQRLPELQRITGASYFELGMYNEAVEWLEKYSGSGSLAKEDKYILAYAYYRLEDYEKAADLFSQVSTGSSALVQNALYHLADCHLKLNDKNQARMAFSSASKMDYDSDIKQDALLNYALLTYELDYSPFNEAVVALNEYIDTYPDSKRIDEAYNYLVLAYMNAKNYRLALASLDKIRNKSNDIKKAYQKISYYRGLELFNDLNLQQAIDMFRSSASLGNFDNEINALSLYWTGEAWYRLGDFAKAAEAFEIFLSQPGASGYKEYPMGAYSLGYSYFNMKRYSDARGWFAKYTGMMKNQKSNLLTDAYNRLGDCYYVQADYSNAVISYDNAVRIGAGNIDYAMLQKGLALGASGRDLEKLETLDQLVSSYPNSTSKAEASFQIAETYMKLKQNDRAINAYNEFLRTYPNSTYAKKAYLNLGLIYFNTGNADLSISNYKQVINGYPGTPEAESALLGLKNVYMDQNNVDTYYNYVGTLGILSSEDLMEQDDLSYQSAEKIYMQGNYTQAIESLKSYISNHPDGRYLTNAHFYLGDCYYRANQNAEALSAFDYVLSQPDNNFTEQALLGTSRIKFRLKEYQSALEYYARLEQKAENKRNLFEARMGLLRCYYLTEDYSRVPETADRIIATGTGSPDQQREARFLKAKSLLARDRQMLALEEFLLVSKEVSSIEGAESKFRVAEIYFQRNQMDEAEKVISEFAEKSTPHQYWMAKSFLLWADIFLNRGDIFQSRQTLQSLIDYYENSDDGILAQAKDKLQKLEPAQTQSQPQPAQDENELEFNLNP